MSGINCQLIVCILVVLIRHHGLIFQIRIQIQINLLGHIADPGDLC